MSIFLFIPKNFLPATVIAVCTLHLCGDGGGRRHASLPSQHVPLKEVNVDDLLSAITRSRCDDVCVLVTVVVAFFICWAPFHTQRLLINHRSPDPADPLEVQLYTALYYSSGIA